jgi:hypothetical protein
VSNVRNALVDRRVFDAFILSGLFSCGVLLGNVKPIQERATGYVIESPDPEHWAPVDPEILFPGMYGTAAEMAFRHKKTGATMVLHTSCRTTPEMTVPDPKALTNELFRGIPNLSLDSQSEVVLSTRKALLTKAHTKHAQQLQTLVVNDENCTYDFFYLGPTGKKEMQAFERYWKSLQFKRN